MAEPDAPRALVVDDETQMLSIVEFALETQDFVVIPVRSAEEAWQRLTRERIDLVVLDITLPGASGLELCERLRARSDVPVLMVTARTREDDRIAGLLAGADDYVTKPFSPRELALRAQAIVRRSRRPGHAGEIVNGPLRVDLHRRDAWIGTSQLRLSDLELRLLGALAARPGQVVEWSDLLNLVWATDEPVGGRDMIKTTVYRLRQHLGRNRDWIIAVRGQGYLMPQLDDDA